MKVFSVLYESILDKAKWFPLSYFPTGCDINKSNLLEALHCARQWAKCYTHITSLIITTTPWARTVLSPHFRSKLELFTQGHTEDKQLSLWCQRKGWNITSSTSHRMPGLGSCKVFSHKTAQNSWIRRPERKEIKFQRTAAESQQSGGTLSTKQEKEKSSTICEGLPQPSRGTPLLLVLRAAAQKSPGRGPRCEGSRWLGLLPWKLSPVWGQHSVY